MEIKKIKYCAALIFLLGVLARCYGLTDHWKNNDHYNYGGAMMTHALNCLKVSPWEVSRGLIISKCDTPQPSLYLNYTPFFLYGMWGTTWLFGNGEWAHRLFFLFFSALNILLVFLIAREAWPKEPKLWLLAEFFQAFFLSAMYMGTHIDPITEFTLTPMLVSSLMTLRGRLHYAGLWALIAGLTTWIGYFQFVPLLLYSWSKNKKIVTVMCWCIVSASLCFASMMFLRNTLDIWHFVGQKLTDPEYIRPQSIGEKLLLVLALIRNFFQSLSRLLGPLFAGFALYEFFHLLKGLKVQRFRLVLSENQWAFVLTGLAFFSYMVPGHKYAMVHIHNYIFAIPMWALLAAQLGARMFKENNDLERKESSLLALLILVSVASYPYGIYQSSLIHDVINSIVFVGTSLAFIYLLFRRELTRVTLAGLITLTALANFSQVVNYRNEPDTEYSFCQWAKQEHQRTGQTLVTNVRRTLTKDFLYCRGIPIEYRTESP